MSDAGEPETLTMLEARLAAALDKIAKSLEAREAAPEALEDPGLTSGALEDAQARIATLESQLAETQASLEEAEKSLGDSAKQDADTLAKLTEERDTLKDKVASLEAARQADRDEYNRTLAARDTALGTMKADLEAAKAKPIEAPSDNLDAMRNRVKRLRTQRATARAERDEALDLVEELQDAGADPNPRLAAMRVELVQLRVANADLLATIEDLRTAATPDVGDMDQAMVDEIAALRAARAAEAAELERILADLGGTTGKEKANA